MNYKEVTDKATITSVINGYKRTKLYNMLYQFQQDAIALAEVDTTGYSKPASCTAALKSSIRRFGFANLKATTQNGKTYLINEDIDVQ